MHWLGTAFNGFTIEAIDGAAGYLGDLLFDDKTWQVRWIAVDTGKWLDGRRVLIHPSSLQTTDSDTSTLKIFLSKSQLRNSPVIQNGEALSRQMERSLSLYYGYDPDANGAWCRPGGKAPPPVKALRPLDGSVAAMMARQRRKLSEPHLRSVAEVEGYLISATDGDAGFLQNVVIDDESWYLHDIVIDVPTWWSVKQVVIPTAAVERISWSERCIRLDRSRQMLKTSQPLFETGMMGSPYAVLMRAYHAWKMQTRITVGAE